MAAPNRDLAAWRKEREAYIALAAATRAFDVGDVVTTMVLREVGKNEWDHGRHTGRIVAKAPGMHPPLYIVELAPGDTVCRMTHELDLFAQKR